MMLSKRVTITCGVGVLLLSATGCERKEEPALSLAMDWGSEARVIDVMVGSGTPRWSISSEPTIRLGSIDDADGLTFGSVSFAAQRRSGEVVVVDPTNMSVTLLDEDGLPIRRVGRSGEGPGEFTMFSGIFRLDADSLLIYDDLLQRFTVLSPDLSLVDSYSVPYRTDGMGMRAALGSRRHLLWRTITPAADFVHGDTTRTGFGVFTKVQDEAGYDTVMVVPGILRMFAVERVAGGRGEIRALRMIPLGRQPALAGNSKHVVISGTDQPEFGVFTVEGRLLHVIRLLEGELPLIDAETARRYEAYLRETSSDPPSDEWAGAVSLLVGTPMRHHEELRLFGQQLWVLRAKLPWENPEFREYLVIDIGGGEVSTIRIPSSYRLFDVNGNRLTAVVLGEFDVSIVVVHEILMGRP